MTDVSKTLIAALVDRSASMSTSKVATEKGFNQLIKDQAKEEGTAVVTLAQFDDISQRSAGWWNTSTSSVLMPRFGHLEKVPPVPEFVYKFQDITSVPKLKIEPRGNTPLLDAIGNFVTEVGKDLSKMREQDRPGTVIVAILTDGAENTSKEWTEDRVRNLIKQQEDAYKWRFIFLGSNIDAVDTGMRYGFREDSSMTYDDDSPVAVASAMASVSSYMTNTRSGNLAAASFTAADRSAAMGRQDGESQSDYKDRLKAKATSST